MNLRNCGKLFYNWEVPLIPNPIRKVLSSMKLNGVRCLLMGGQACVLYGAAEFSRDIDFAVLCQPDNLEKLRTALKDLSAKLVAVPPFEADYLLRGHAVHFRCEHPDAGDLRVDVMSNMRGVAPFDQLWNRRTVLSNDQGFECDLLSLPDLVAAKKTQRDKDWPMIRRLVEANYFQNREQPAPQQIEFWLREMRTAELLIEVVLRYSERVNVWTERRPLLRTACKSDRKGLEAALLDEEMTERALDREYWLPLKKELEGLRHGRNS